MKPNPRTTKVGQNTADAAGIKNRNLGNTTLVRKPGRSSIRALFLLMMNWEISWALEPADFKFYQQGLVRLKKNNIFLCFLKKNFFGTEVVSKFIKVDPQLFTVL